MPKNKKPRVVRGETLKAPEPEKDDSDVEEAAASKARALVASLSVPAKGVQDAEGDDANSDGDGDAQTDGHSPGVGAGGGRGRGGGAGRGGRGYVGGRGGQPGEDARPEHIKEEQARTVFVGGIPWSCSREVVTKDFEDCGEIDIMRIPASADGDGLKGIAFITYKTAEGAEKALKFNGTDYGGRTLQVNLAGERPEKGQAKGGKGKDGKGKGKAKGGKGEGVTAEEKAAQDELTVVLKGLPWKVTEESLREDFSSCGEIDRFNLPMNDEGRPRGLAFIQFTTAEGVSKALEYNDTLYKDRWIRAERIGDGGGDGAKGGGKGKLKGKGKNKGQSKDKDDDGGKRKSSTWEDNGGPPSKALKRFSDSEDDE